MTIPEESKWTDQETRTLRDCRSFGMKVFVVEGLLPAVMGLVCVGSGDEVAGVSKIGAVEQGLLMLSNGEENLKLAGVSKIGAVEQGLLMPWN
jgi:hypothetical protein